MKKNEMEHIIKEYLKTKKHLKLHTVEGSKGMCDSISNDIYKLLKEKGIESEIIEGIGYLPNLDDTAHSDWLAFKGKDQRFLAHVVIKIENMVIDLTGAQFGISYAKRTLFPFSDFKKEWKTIKKGPIY